MAKSHPGLKLLTNYLKTEFPWKKDYICKTEEINTFFTYQEVVDALFKLKTTDPTLHKLLSYRYMTNRSRNAISESLYMDSSTLKRQWDRAMFILQNWLMHGTIPKDEINFTDNKEVLLEPLDAIDALYKNN